MIMIRSEFDLWEREKRKAGREMMIWKNRPRGKRVLETKVVSCDDTYLPLQLWERRRKAVRTAAIRMLLFLSPFSRFLAELMVQRGGGRFFIPPPPIANRSTVNKSD